LQDLRNRGATEVDLIGTSGHDGLLAAVGSLFTATPRQRCVVHKQRNVLNAVPHRERQEVTAELLGIWKQEKKEDALTNLAAFKAKYSQRYPEAIRSLGEDEEHYHLLLSFLIPVFTQLSGWCHWNDDDPLQDVTCGTVAETGFT
jgi:transposase-like protein